MQFEPEIVKLLNRKDLSSKESKDLFSAAFQGRLNETELKTLLLLLAEKGETFQEVAGAVSALKEQEPPQSISIQHLMDTCGTGGDGSHSINVSTLSALVIAGAGGKVAKHGNRGISSKCGSSDLLEALGVRLDSGSGKMMAAIQKFGIGYFHAPYHHPVFSKMQPLRKKLGTRTLFNLLGPLSNPVSVHIQLVGVSRPEYVSLFANVLACHKNYRALVCHSSDGLDEISTLKPTRYGWVQNGKIRYGIIDPKKLGFKQQTNKVTAGTVKANVSIAKQILKNRFRGTFRDLVVINAGAGLWISGIAGNLKEGIQKADYSITSGKALSALKGLIKVSNS